jgi:hypothetical protein
VIPTSLTTAADHDSIHDCVAAAGYYGANGQQATACPAGFFKASVGATFGTDRDCSPCGAGTYSTTAATACSTCPTNTVAPVAMELFRTGETCSDSTCRKVRLR